jgi:hypothetical protein
MTALAARRSAPQHWAPWTGNRPPSAVTSHRMFNAGSSTVKSSSRPSLWPEWTADAMVDGAGASPIVVTVRAGHLTNLLVARCGAPPANDDLDNLFAT